MYWIHGRTDDVEAIVPSTLKVEPDHTLRAVLKRTKTTGEDKAVKEVTVVIDAEAYVQGWQTTFMEVFEECNRGLPARDYFIPMPTADLGRSGL